MFARQIHRLCVLNRYKLNQSLRCYSYTYYDVLGVKRTASQKEIQKAFLEKSKQLHPDKKINDNDQHDRFVQLNEAYTCLSRSESREYYDATLPRLVDHTEVRLSAKAGRKGLFRVAKNTYYKIVLTATIAGCLFAVFYITTMDLYLGREQELFLIFKSPEALDEGEEEV